MSSARALRAVAAASRLNTSLVRGRVATRCNDDQSGTFDRKRHNQVHDLFVQFGSHERAPGEVKASGDLCPIGVRCGLSTNQPRRPADVLSVVASSACAMSHPCTFCMITTISVTIIFSRSLRECSPLGLVPLCLEPSLPCDQLQDCALWSS
jgi:anti-sigma factor RsiW